MIVTYPSDDESVTVAFLISDGNTLSVVQEATFTSTATPGIVWTTVTYSANTPITIPSGTQNVKVTGDASALAPAAFATNITNPLKGTADVVNIDLSEITYTKYFLPTPFI